MADDAPLDAILGNIFAFYSAWGLRFPGGQVLPDRDLIIIDAAAPIPELNIGFVQDGPDPAAAAQRAADLFARRGRAWRLEGSEAQRELLDPIARGAGLREYRARPTLAVRVDELQPSGSPADLAVEVVRTPASSASFVATLYEGMSGEKPPALPPLASLPPEGFTLYLGVVDGEPLATCVLFVHRGVAGIYAVSTIPRGRRRGYGRWLTERAVRDGAAQGCRWSALQATEMGRPVYERMGFRRVVDRPCWTTSR